MGSRAPELPIACVPAAVRSLLAALADAGHPSVLVGGCVRDLVAGHPVHDFDVATPAPPEVVLARFARAVPIGLRHGTVMIPTAAGPVDVTSFRGGTRDATPGASGDAALARDLGLRDFTVNALAWRLDPPELVDLHGGLADLAAGRLRAVGSPDERLAEDPLRALRAARLLAERGLRPDAALVRAMAKSAAALASVAGERLRQELDRILLAPAVEAGLALLRETGIESVLAAGVDPAAAARVASLPARRDDRFVGWLLATTPGPVSSRLRISRARADRIERLIRAHPVTEGVDPDRLGAVRRLLHRFEPDDLELLLALAASAGAQGGPPDGDAEAKVARLRAAIARVRAERDLALHRRDLALDGDAVAAALGRGPGPVIGEALRYLTECVLDDPSINTADGLRERLHTWASQRGTERAARPDRGERG